MRQFYGHRRHRRLVAAVLTLGILAAACGGDDAEDPTGGGGGGDGGSGDGEAPEGDPIRVGISLPLTGEFSEPGTGVQQGYETWAGLVNESGGLLGRPVELVFRDDASDPNRVVSDYESLITQEEVDLVFGPFSTRLVIPAAEVAESYDMLFVEPAGAAPEVFEQGFEYLFYAAPAIASDHYDYLAEWILDLPEDERPETAAYATLDDPFAQGTAYGLKDALEEAGVETDYLEIGPEVDADGALALPVLTSYLRNNPDVRAIGTQHGDVTAVIPEALKATGREPGDVIVGGVDLTPATALGLREGYVTVALDQQPYAQGYLPVLQCVLSRVHGFDGLTVDTAAGPVTPETVSALLPLIDKGVR
jgi:ABC-type branched-subunit amino acid transport system substrate-binding protein